MPETPESPYRPPAATIGAAPEGPRHYEATGTISISLCVKEAWAALLRNVGPLFGAALLVAGMGLGLIIVLGALAAVWPGAGALLVLGLLYVVVTPMLGWGAIKFSLNAIDGRARVGDIFGIFERLGARLGSTMLLWLILLVLSLPGSLPQWIVQLRGSPDLTLFGLAYLWNIAWNVLVTIRLLFSFFFLVEGEMGALDALRSSWDCTRSNWLRLVGLFVVSIGIAIAGMLALLVGIIPASVVVWLLYPAAFRQIVGRVEPATAAPAA